MSKETYDILLPFNYAVLHDIPLRQYSSLEYEYNQFLRKYIWQFIDAYNFQFAENKHVRFCFKTLENCFFEGELFAKKEPFFRTFKINKAFLRNTTDFVAWEHLAKLQNLTKLEELEFDFHNNWLSMPNESFFACFQQLKEVRIICHCTEGFDNLINVNEIEETFRKALPQTNIVMKITADFYY